MRPTGVSGRTKTLSNPPRTADHMSGASESDGSAKQSSGLRRPAEAASADVQPVPAGKPSAKAEAPAPAAGNDHPTAHREAKATGETAGTTQRPLSDETPAAHAPATAVVRQTQENVTPVPAAKVASLRIDLSDGKSALATVRERSGAVEVKIVAATPQSAHRIGNEVDGLRQALDSAGLQLAKAEVSYQQPQGHGRERDGSYGEPQQRPAKSNEFFILDEVNE